MSVKPSYQKTIFGCYFSCMTQAVAVNLPPILFIVFRDEFHLSFSQLGTLALFNFCTQILSDLIATRVGDHIGYRRMLVAAHALAGLGLCALSVLPDLLSPFVGLSIATVIYAFGCGMIEVINSPLLESVPDMREKSTAMSLMHSFYSWGYLLVVLVSTLLIRVIGLGNWRWLPLIWALFPLANIPRLLKMPVPTHEASKDAHSIGEMLRQPLFLCAIGMMLCSGASEVVMSQWASLFAQLGLGLSKSAGDLMGPCLFAALMGIGRVIYGAFGTKMRMDIILILSGLMCVACYLMASLSGSAVVSFVGCALCGLSIAIMWPGTMSLTATRCHGSLTAMFGLMAVAGDIGCSVGPWMMGLITDAKQASLTLLGAQHTAQLAMKYGLAYTTVFPILLVIFTLLMRKRHETR